MKTIQVSAVTEMVRQAVLKINFDTPANTLARLEEAQFNEPSPAPGVVFTRIRYDTQAVAAEK